MITTTTAGAEAEPLTLEDALHFIARLVTDENGEPMETPDDDLVTAAIAAARNFVEQYTGKYLITQTVTQLSDSFPSCSVLPLVKGPVLSVTSIKGYAADGSNQQLDPDQYVIDGSGKRVVLKDGASWPTVGQVVAGAEVVYTAGYGDAEDVPPAIVQALRHLVAHYYVHRETDAPIPPNVFALLASFRALRL